MKTISAARFAPRRQFLRKLLLAAVPCVLFGPAAVVRAAAGGASSDVKHKGAAGPVRRDDAASIQAAIDALPATGGAVQVPAGTYLIDTDHPLRLRNGTHLQLAADAVLAARPSPRKRFYMVLVDGVSDVEISGGHIVGERDHHLGDGGEWGYGIFVRGAQRVNIHDIQVSKCWGDGICIGGVAVKGKPTTYSEHVTLTRVVCKGNRRQGLTIGPARHVRVSDSEFSDTAGTKPACGIDIEPDLPDSAQDIQIEHCTMRGNQGCGIQVYRNVAQVSLTDCTIADNAGFGALFHGARGGVLSRNSISGNGLAGAVFRGGTRDCRVNGNTFAGNATHAVKRLLDSVRQASLKSASDSTRDIQVMDDATAITVSGNTFKH